MSKSELILDSLVESEDQVSQSSWIPLNKRESLSTWHIVGISCSMIGYGASFSVMFALVSPILYQLGFEQEAISFIWLAGPLSGFLVQPLIGYYSDRCKSKYGKRRPFILTGGAGSFLCFIVFNYIEQIGKIFGSNNKLMSKIIVVINMYVCNACVNILYGPSRAILNDLVPDSQQIKANSIASLMLGAIGVITNFVGGIKTVLPSSVNIDNKKVTFTFGMIVIAFGTITTLICGQEEQMTEEPRGKNPIIEVFRAFKDIPSPLFKISIVYFIAWIAYFPFLLLCTDYFGSDIFGGVADSKDPAKVALYNSGVSFGCLVLAVSYAIVLVYNPVQEKLIKWAGLRFAFALSQIIEAIVLLSALLVRNKYILMALFSTLGMTCGVMNSIPYAILGLSVNKDRMGVYMGVLNIFVVVAQQFSSFLLGTFLYKILPVQYKSKGAIIASGSLFAVIAAVACKWIEVPNEDNKFESFE